MSPEEGHTWEITIRERASYGVTGEPGYRDAEDWGQLRTQTVRAWSLASALEKVSALPVGAWFDSEHPHRDVKFPISQDEAQQIHDLARGTDPDHDQSPCFCCCMDCDIDPVKDTW